LPASQAAKKASPSEAESESMCPASAKRASEPVSKPPMTSTTMKALIRAKTIARARLLACPWSCPPSPWEGPACPCECPCE
jgi:hypothetical protein